MADDQLREQLLDAAHCYMLNNHRGTTHWVIDQAQTITAAIWPVVAAALSSARADTAERIAAKIESFDGTIAIARAIDPALISLEVVAHNPVQGEAMHKVIGYHAAKEAAALARSVVPQTKEQQ